MNLSGTVVVITGASRGIGKALKEAFEAEGAIVAGCAKTGLDDIATVDVTNARDVVGFVRDTIAEHGKIDVLINNAGVAHDLAPLEEMSVETYKECMAANVDSVFHAMHAVLPVLKKQHSGCIINIASRAAQRAHPHLSVYSASKYAVVGLTHAVAQDLKETSPDVLCFAVSPGGVGTDMRKDLFGEEDAAAQQTPNAVAACIVSALKDASVNNGDNLIVSGGEVVEVLPM